MVSSNKRRALGRGLTNLIPVESEDTQHDNDVMQVDINVIRTNPFQPRQDFDKEEINNLAQSIKEQGLLQPILLRKQDDGYEIISGERRFRALKHLGYDKVPCIIKIKVTDHEMMEMALVENIQRENLNDMEQAIAYQRLMTECNLSHEEISQKVGKSRSTITNFLRLLKLPDEIQNMVRRKELTMGHARALLGLDDPLDQRTMAEKIIADNLSVRDIEKTAQNSKDASSQKARTIRRLPPEDPDILQQMEKLRYHFGTMVNILRSNEHKGKVEIHFYSIEDLNRILDLLYVKA